MKNIMSFTKVRDVISPNRAHSTDAGIDFYIPKDFYTNYNLEPGESVLIPSGIKAIVPTGHALIAFNKSGVATKKGLYIGAAVVDETYTGEIHIHLTNVSDKNTVINPDEKICQFILIPISNHVPFEISNEGYTQMSENFERGANGFGSTDNKEIVKTKIEASDTCAWVTVY